MTTNNNHGAADDYERVRPEWSCPRCGEDDIDLLVWIDDDRVCCDHCGTTYNPNWRKSDSLGD
jgi:rubredoxin